MVISSAATRQQNTDHWQNKLSPSVAALVTDKVIAVNEVSKFREKNLTPPLMTRFHGQKARGWGYG